MYNNYFGFSESPFNITPNSRFYYHTESCREVLEVVQHGIETRKGLIVIVGEAGSGKTLFLKFLVRALEPKARTIVVQDPRADLDIILRLLMERLELHGPVDDRTARLDRLTDYLITERQAGRIVCLLIDEAQDLEASTLDELRLLANLEFDADALLPMVLVGQPELNVKLDHPSATRIKQRVALTRNIYPLIRKELEPYIDTRLKVAGYENGGLFNPEALDAIAAHSGGIPRMVNSICDNSLFRAYTMSQRVISAAIVDQVARELRVSAPMSFQKGFNRAAVESAFIDGSEPFTEDRPVEFPDLEKQPAEMCHGSSGFHVLGSPGDITEPANRIKTARAKMAAKRGPDAPQTAHQLPPVEGPTGIPDKLLSARTGWYAFGGGVALCLLALNVNSSQLAGIYSALSGKNRTPIADPSPLGSQHEQAPKNVATARPETEIRSNNDNASGETNTQPAQPISPPPPSLSDGGFRPAQPPETSAVKKNENRPAAVTLEVVKRSKVRAKPNNESEIIAELEPGNRVTVLAQSRDYYHVRSVDDKTIRGYVHREDAFFESTTRR